MTKYKALIEKLRKKEQTESYRKFFEVFKNYPHKFITDILQVNFYKHQKDLFDFILNNDKIVVIGCRRIGKTFTVLCASLYYACCYPNLRVNLFYPTVPQVYVSFKMLHELILKTQILTNYIAEFQGKTVLMRKEIQFKNGSIILGKSSGEQIQGLESSIIFIDEVDDISQEVVSEIILPTGARKKELNKIIICGVPRTTNGTLKYFYTNPNFKQYPILDWKVGVESGILDEQYVSMVRLSSTEQQFARAFECKFTVEENFFGIEQLIPATITLSPNLIVFGIDTSLKNSKTALAVLAKQDSLIWLLDCEIYDRKTLRTEDIIYDILEKAQYYRPNRICCDTYDGSFTFLLNQHLYNRGLLMFSQEELAPEERFAFTTYMSRNFKLHKYTLLHTLLKTNRLLISDILSREKIDLLENQLKNVVFDEHTGMPKVRDPSVGEDLVDAICFALEAFEKTESTEIPFADAVFTL